MEELLKQQMLIIQTAPKDVEEGISTQAALMVEQAYQLAIAWIYLPNSLQEGWDLLEMKISQ